MWPKTKKKKMENYGNILIIVDYNTIFLEKSPPNNHSQLWRMEMSYVTPSMIYLNRIGIKKTVLNYY